jgi:hypothetical protein
MGLLRVLEVEPATRVQDLLERVDKLLAGGGPVSPGKPEAQSAHTASELKSSAPVVETIEHEPKPEPIVEPVQQAQPAATRAPEPKIPRPEVKARPRAEEQPPLPVPPEEVQTVTQPEPIAEQEAEVMAQEAIAQAPESQIPVSAAGCSAGVCIEPDQEEMYAQWRVLVTSILQENPFVASILEHARLVQFGNTQTELGFAESENFFADGARQSQNFAFIESAVRKHFNFETTVKLRRLGPDQVLAYPSLAQLKEEEFKEEVSAIEKDTRSDPRLQDAVSILGGKIQSVVVLKPES